jgi:hypothetical protein
LVLVLVDEHHALRIVQCAREYVEEVPGVKNANEDTQCRLEIERERKQAQRDGKTLDGGLVRSSRVELGHRH